MRAALRLRSQKTLTPLSAKELKSAAKGRGAESDIPEAEPKKNPENSVRFRGVKSNQTRDESISFYHPDCYCRLWNFTSIVLCCRLKSALRLAGFTADRELHPAPKVCIWLARLYRKLHALISSAL